MKIEYNPKQERWIPHYIKACHTDFGSKPLYFSTLAQCPLCNCTCLKFRHLNSKAKKLTEINFKIFCPQCHKIVGKVNMGSYYPNMIPNIWTERELDEYKEYIRVRRKKLMDKLFSMGFDSYLRRRSSHTWK